MGFLVQFLLVVASNSGGAGTVATVLCDGKPVVGAGVFRAPRPPGIVFHESLELLATTDGLGRFVLPPGIPPATPVWVGGRECGDSLPVVLGNGATLIRLPEPAKLEVVIKDDAGTLISATVEISGVPPDGRPVLTGLSSPMHSAAFTRPAGLAEITARAPGYTSKTERQALGPGLRVVTMELGRRVAVIGRVTGAGRALGGALVSTPGVPDHDGELTTDVDGRFSLSLPLGQEPYSISVRARGFRPLIIGGRVDDRNIDVRLSPCAPTAIYECEPIEVLGVGVVLEGIRVQAVVPGSDAALFLRVGDLIESIDGERALPATAKHRLRGRDGSQVVIRVHTAAGEREIKVRRKRLQVAEAVAENVS